MAYTIHQQPTWATAYKLVSGYNEQNYVVKSTNNTQDNYQYCLDVYVNGSKVKRLKKAPHPTYGVGVFDIKGIVEPYLSYDLDLTSTDGFKQNPNSYATVYVIAGEEYGLSSTGATYYASATGDTYYAINSSLEQIDFLTSTIWNAQEYQMGTSASKFLTNMPRTMTLFDNQRLWINFTHFQNYVYKCLVKTYDINDNVLGTYRFDNTFNTPDVDVTDRFLRVAAGWNLNDVTLSSGTQPILTSGVAYYILSLVDNSNNPRSEGFTFYLDEDCTMYDIYELHFQNAFGGFDSFQFRRQSTETDTIVRREYKQNTGKTASTSYTVTPAQRGTQSYYTAADRVTVLRSGWINEQQFEWLRELVESPQVFWFKDWTTSVAVNIIDTSYTVQKDTNLELYNLTISMKLSSSNYRQRY
jgi:hypothetical protein